MKKLKEYFTKGCAKRAIRTFVQTACAYIVTNLTCSISGITNIGEVKSIIIGVVISSISAGISALMNLKEEC